jgi:hypothetical protein
VFFVTTNVTVNSPRFTINSPQLHHKNTTIKTQLFAKPPAKTRFPPQQKKLEIFKLQNDTRTCQKQRESASCSISEVLPWH